MAFLQSTSFQTMGRKAELDIVFVMSRLNILSTTMVLQTFKIRFPKRWFNLGLSETYRQAWQGIW